MSRQEPGTAALRRPPALLALGVCALVDIVGLIGLPVTMMINRSATLTSIRNRRPDLEPDEVAIGFLMAVGTAALLHTIAVVLLLWLTAKALRRRPWARVGLTILLIVMSVLGLGSAAASPLFLAVVIGTITVQLVMLGLLWLPPSMRKLFPAPTSAK